jgi:hypothetical protein
MKSFSYFGCRPVYTSSGGSIQRSFFPALFLVHAPLGTLNQFSTAIGTNTTQFRKTLFAIRAFITADECLAILRERRLTPLADRTHFKRH